MIIRMPASPARQRRWFMIGIGTLCLLAVFGLYRGYALLAEHAREMASQQLQSVAALKSREIRRWLDDRLTLLSQPPDGAMARNLDRLLRGRDTADANRTLQARFRYLRARIPEIGAIGLYDLDDRLVTSSGVALSHGIFDVRYVEAVRAMKASGRPRFIDLQHDPWAQDVRLQMLVPLTVGPEENAQPIGYALFQIDPWQQFFPLVSAWPLPSPSAESFLVRQEGNDIVGISPLRHVDTPPLSVRRAADTPGLIAGRALRGEGSLLAGVDYRGTPVLGATLRIPDTEWLLVAKIDDSEIYTGIHRTLTLAGALMAALLLLLLLLGRALLARQQAETRMAALEQEKQHFETLALAEKALAESELLLRGLGDNLPDSYMYQTTRTAAGKWRYLYVSNGVEHIAGIAADALLRDIAPFYARIETADLPGLIAAEDDSLARQADFDHEFRIHHPDGEIRWLHARARPIRRGNDEVIWNGVVTDITAHKLAEIGMREALAAAERFRAALDHVPANVYMKDIESRYVYGNQQLLELFGCTAQELAGASDERFFPPETVWRLREIDLRALAGEETAEEVDVTYPNGERVVYWEVKAPIYRDDEHKEIWGVCGISSDITAKKRTEELLLLQARRALFQLELPSIADSLDEMDFMQRGLELAEDMTGSEISFIHFVKEDAQTIELGTWSRRTLDIHCHAAFERHYPIEQAGIWAEAFRLKRTMVFNDYASAPDKRGLPAGHAALRRLVSLPVIEQGQVVMLAGIGNKASEYTEQDVQSLQLLANDIWRIVRKKRFERELADNLAHQRQLNQKLEEAQNQLLQSEKMASIGQLAAGVAHELNNPIGFISSNLGTLDSYLYDIFAITTAYEAAETAAAARCPELDAVRALKREKDFDFLKTDIVQLMAETKDGLARVAKIVRDLKDFSRAGDAVSQWANVHQGLDSTLNIVWNELKYKCTIHKAYGNLPQIWCVPSQINQVFMNLLVNAAHAIPERGDITIRTGQQGAEIFVAITDNGSGIAPEHLNRIFEPFFTTKPVGKGTGLGLSLAYSIVQKHQGRFEVASEPGRGTTFTVWLPIEAPPPPPQSSITVSPAPTS